VKRDFIINFNQLFLFYNILGYIKVNIVMPSIIKKKSNGRRFLKYASGGNAAIPGCW
jgi:hypothetical protein